MSPRLLTAMLLLALALLSGRAQAAGSDTLAVGGAGAAAACRAHFACLDDAGSAAALEDAAALGFRCDAGDVDCHRRLLEAERLVRAVVFRPIGAAFEALVVEVGQPGAKRGEGADMASALAAALAPPSSEAPPVPPTPVPPSTPPPASTVEAPAPEGSSSFVPFAVAGSAGAVSVITAGGAAFVSYGIAQELDDAGNGGAPIEDYAAKNGAFWGLAIASGAFATLAVSALAWAVVSPSHPEPDG